MQYNPICKRLAGFGQPYIYFLDSVYFENDDEVKEDIKAILENSEGESLRSKIAFEGTDTSKFKDDIEPLY